MHLRLVRNLGLLRREIRPPYLAVSTVVSLTLDQWNPSHCGFVDIAIDRDGRWFHGDLKKTRQWYRCLLDYYDVRTMALITSLPR